MNDFAQLQSTDLSLFFNSWCSQPRTPSTAPAILPTPSKVPTHSTSTSHPTAKPEASKPTTRSLPRLAELATPEAHPFIFAEALITKRERRAIETRRKCRKRTPPAPFRASHPGEGWRRRGCAERAKKARRISRMFTELEAQQRGEKVVQRTRVKGKALI
jgi:hypothetical protein